MKKIYAVINMVVIIATITWNYVINSIGINGNTIREISSQYSNLFTPASYAFSIWGIIFLREHLSLQTIMGGLMILFGVALTTGVVNAIQKKPLRRRVKGA